MPFYALQCMFLVVESEIGFCELCEDLGSLKVEEKSCGGFDGGVLQTGLLAYSCGSKQRNVPSPNNNLFFFFPFIYTSSLSKKGI